MEIIEYEHLAPGQQSGILSLAQRVQSQDGVFPLNEDAILSISHGTGRHLLAQDCDEIIGYAYADSAAQIVVDPTRRRQGIATQLLAHLDPSIDLWAFGNGEPAQHFCAAQNYIPVRVVLVMELHISPDTAAAPGGGGSHRRRMGNLLISHPSTGGVGSRRGRPPHPDKDPASGRMTGKKGEMTMTTFQPWDLQSLVRLNARSFADHPEQGQMTIDDFTERMESDWFDPEGLLIARDDNDTMIGFHWTKVENGIGEVYVLGVDPDHSGAGVGGSLLQAGLAYLSSRGVNTVRLWVDDDNHNAQSLYVKSGFSPIRQDIRYRRVDEQRRIG